MKSVFVVFVFLANFSFCQSHNSLEIKQLIDGFINGNLAEIKSLMKAEDFYQNDSSHEKNSYILLYSNKNKEGLGIQVLGEKIDMLDYSVPTKERYDTLKAELARLDFMSEKPYENQDKGIIEEIGFIKENTLIIASNRKAKDGRAIYDFVITKNF